MPRRTLLTDRRGREGPPTIGVSGWLAVAAVLALAYVALANADMKGGSADEGARSMSPDAFMRLIGFGY